MRVALCARRVTLVVLVLLCAACTPTKTKPAEAFVSEEGHFLVELPGKPKTDRASVGSGADKLRVVTYSTEDDTEAVSASFVDYPTTITAKAPTDVLAAAASGAVTAVQGKMTSSKALTFLGGDALDFTIQSLEGTTTVRAFMVGNRMYLLQVVTKDFSGRPKSFDRLISTVRFA
jgi:hypothetical protein